MSRRTEDWTRSSVDSQSPASRRAADRAYRRAWWFVALYPVSFVGAFVVGEGLLSLLTDGAGDAGDAGDVDPWQVLLAGLPALLVFVAPGVLAVGQGRRAMRLGRQDGRVPAWVAGGIAIAFGGVNVASYLVGLLVELVR